MQNKIAALRELAAKGDDFGQLVQAVSPIVFTSVSASLGPNCASLLERGLITDSEALLSPAELLELLAAKLLADADIRQDDSNDDPVDLDSDAFDAKMAEFVTELMLKKATPDYNFAYANLDAFPSEPVARAALAAALISVSHTLGRTCLPLWEDLALFKQVKDDD